MSKQIRKLIKLGYEYYGDSRLNTYYCHCCDKTGVNIITFKEYQYHQIQLFKDQMHDVILCNTCLKKFNSIKLRNLRINKLNRII